MSERITLTVEVSLDAVPGTFATPESARDVVEYLLERSIPHYGPKVTIGPKVEEPKPEARTCEAMHWYAENYGVQCTLEWGHELNGQEEHDFEGK